jgi:dephospho-CoA kinase
MITAIITGGLASGKSAALRLIRESWPQTQCFDADACVHQLYQRETVREWLRETFGAAALNGTGEVDRSWLREKIFTDEAARREIEAYLHPLVRQTYEQEVAQARAGGEVAVFIAEVPLFYESEFDVRPDYEIIVAISPAQQWLRARKRSPISDDLLQRLLASQMPLMDKIHRAGLVIWNGGSIACLTRQIHRLKERLLQPHHHPNRPQKT